MAHFGKIYKFVTGKVIGQPGKPKFHITIDLDQGLMLMINSDPYEGAMEINRADWPQMPRHDSFISCNKVLRYGRSDLEGVQITPCGALSRDCITRLREHMEDCLAMEQHDIDAVLAAIDKHLK